MAKTVVDHTDGSPRTYKLTRSRRRSEAQLIPWTAGPQNRRQKIARALWG